MTKVTYSGGGFTGSFPVVDGYYANVVRRKITPAGPKDYTKFTATDARGKVVLTLGTDPSKSGR